MNNTDYTTIDGTNIKIFYLQFEEDTCPLNYILSYLNAIYVNIASNYSKEIFKNLKIEIWNPLRSDIPTEGVNVGDLENAGLTWGDNRLIKLKTLNNRNIDIYKYMSNLFSHEFGHYFSSYVGFNKDTIFKKHWLSYRGIDSNYSTNKDELFAEDFRLLLGSLGAKDYERGNYVQANKKRGLKDMLLMYKMATDYLSSQPYTNFTNLRFDYSDANLDFFGMQFYENHNEWFNWFNDFYTYINKNGIYNWINNQWIKVR